MTHERDVERLLDHWFADGPSEAPDRVLDEVAGLIHRRRQRPAWLLTRRLPDMPAPIRLIAVAAVLVGALVLGSLFVAGGAGPSPTPAPSPATTPAPSARAFHSSQVMAPGEYVADLGTGTVRFTLPGGWGSPGETRRSFSLRLTSGPADDIVNVWGGMRRAAKDATCTEAAQPGVGATAAALLADLQADDQLQVSAPAPVRLPGLTGTRVDVRTSIDATRTCPFSEGRVTVPLVVDTLPGEGPFWGVGPGEVERVYLLDTADGGNVVIIVDSGGGESFEALAAAAAVVIDSMSFTPAQ